MNTPVVGANASLGIAKWVRSASAVAEMPNDASLVGPLFVDAADSDAALANGALEALDG